MRLDHLFLSTSSARNSYSKKTQVCVNSYEAFVRILFRSSMNLFIRQYLYSASSIIFFFPVSMAGLILTFPSRTRSIRGPATMVLYTRVRESSSMPDFFCLHQNAVRLTDGVLSFKPGVEKQKTDRTVDPSPLVLRRDKVVLAGFFLLILEFFRKIPLPCVKKISLSTLKIRTYPVPSRTP